MDSRKTIENLQEPAISRADSRNIIKKITGISNIVIKYGFSHENYN